MTLEIRKAKLSEVNEIKQLVDSVEEMDVTRDTFGDGYYERLIRSGILLVAIDQEKVVGVCFGTINSKEKWADLLGLIVEIAYRKQGVGSTLVQEFEKIAKQKKVKEINLYADRLQIGLFNKLGYTQGRAYTAFRKSFAKK